MSVSFQVTAELTELTKPNANFAPAVTAEALQAFQALRRDITSAPVLAVPDHSRPFVVATDASGFGIGAVLMQADPDTPGNTPIQAWRLITFHSAKLSPAEKNYPVGVNKSCLLL